jgi:hypothetical protein
MSDALLMAGALVAADREVSRTVPVDDVHARRYVHRGLGDRAVVRLSAAKLAAGDDVEMKLLGFGDAEDLGVVGKRRQQVLGFPAWALVHEPKKAKYALEVVEELRKHARVAKTKPGNAKAGFDAIGKRLAQTVPRFLPSYWEEVGRAYAAAGAVSYAGQAFEKAREAERVYALEIDEDHRREAFLEFALFGALSNKTLGAYAQELTASRSPEDAYHHYYELAVRRTLVVCRRGRRWGRS